MKRLKIIFKAAGIALLAVILAIIVLSFKT